MKRILPLGLASLALLVAACGGGAGGGDLAQKTPQQVLASALAAATKAGTVHFNLLGKAKGTSETIVGDASGSDGREIISAGSLKIEAEVVGGGAYVEGNVGGLVNQMGLSAATAQAYAGKWISIAATDPPYASLARAVTLAATLTELRPSGHLTLTPSTTRAARTVIGVHGGLPGTARAGTTGSSVLYVSTSGPAVPVVFDVEQVANGTKESDVGTFSNWGKPLHLAAPTSTVPFSSLPAASSPPQG